MDTEKAIDKIRKLLALAQSDNAGEAENALLFARKLMAEYKLTERDVADAKKPGKLAHEVYRAHSFSDLVNTWMLQLAKVIAENHCCCACFDFRRGSKVKHIRITGLDDDPQVAMVLFDYAVQHILHMSERNRRIHLGWMTNRKAKNALDRAYTQSYAEGFTAGLAAKYREQFIEKNGEVTETALVLVQPVEVKEWQDGLKKCKLRFRQNDDNAEARADGYKAGYNFNPTKQIKEA